MTTSIDTVLLNVVSSYQFEPCDEFTRTLMRKEFIFQLSRYLVANLDVDITDPMNIRVNCGDLLDRVVSFSPMCLESTATVI